MATLCTLVASAVLSHPMRFASFMWVCTACIIPHPSCGCLFCRADCSGSRFYKWGMFLCFVIAPETQWQTPPQQKSTHFMRFCESIAQSQVHALMALWCSEQRTIALYLAIKCPCAGHVWLSAQCVYWGEPAIETNRRQKLETNSLIVLDFWFAGIQRFAPLDSQQCWHIWLHSSWLVHRLTQSSAWLAEWLSGISISRSQVVSKAFMCILYYSLSLVKGVQWNSAPCSCRSLAYFQQQQFGCLESRLRRERKTIKDCLRWEMARATETYER